MFQHRFTELKKCFFREKRRSETNESSVEIFSNDQHFKAFFTVEAIPPYPPKRSCIRYKYDGQKTSTEYSTNSEIDDNTNKNDEQNK